MTALEKIPERESEDNALISMIERVALDPNVSIDKLERMLNMRREIGKEAAEKAFAASFARMQRALTVIKERGAIKNRDGKVQSTYPLWEDVNAALREPLADNDLSMSFDRRKEDGKTFIGCIVTHAMGHSRRAEIDLPRDDSGSKNAVQGEGSTVSYGQRYSSKLLINWVSEGTEDDDGKAAGGQSITADQFTEISNLVDETGSDVPKLLKFIGAEHLEELTIKQFETAMAALRKKKANG